MACVFCEIGAGRMPASIVHDDEHVIAFLDINPATPGHLLVIPRRHAADLAELDPEDGRRMFAAAQQLAAALRRSSLEPAGVNLFLADGEAAGQEVPHAHLHVVPRTTGDGFVVRAAHGSPDRTELDALAREIRAART